VKTAWIQAGYFFTPKTFEIPRIFARPQACRCDWLIWTNSLRATGLSSAWQLQHLFDARVIALVELIETDRLAARCGVELDRKRDQAEADVTLPDTGSHG
jgi:hypothetical protein